MYLVIFLKSLNFHMLLNPLACFFLRQSQKWRSLQNMICMMSSWLPSGFVHSLQDGAMEGAQGVGLFRCAIGAKLIRLAVKLVSLSSTLLSRPAIAVSGNVPFCLCVQRANHFHFTLIHQTLQFVCMLGFSLMQPRGRFVSLSAACVKKPWERKSANYPLTTP